MKVIFLDIDGVLNSNFWNEKHQKEISDGTLIDKSLVSLLGELVRNTNAKIVLHSGWRFWLDDNLQPKRREAAFLIDMLFSENIKIYDVTPDLTTEEIRKTKKFSLIKAQEILLWLELHKEIEKWIVLDDLDLHNETIFEHQIKTDQTIGLTRNDVEKAINMLEGDVDT